MTDRDTRLKRLRIHSWRRGIREMDLLLGCYADARIQDLTDGELDRFEALLSENDQDLYAWACGTAPAPEAHAGTLAALMAFHQSSRKPG